ncbi:MAG: glycosyltransferase, partial [Planctomycetota bacterium]|nr:glycosyltransferase [Planctomycetota bacterium]
GSQENTVISCEGQTNLGHEVHLAFGPIYGPEGSMLERVRAFRAGDGRSITPHEVPDLVREVSPARDHRAYKQLKALIARLRPDVVHTHSSKAGIVGRAAAWDVTPRPAVVHTIHGPPFMPVEGGLFRRWKTRIVNYEYTLAERFAAKQCHMILSVADAMTEQFLARGIGSPELYRTVRSGIDTAPYLNPASGEDRASVRASLGLGRDRFVVGTVARLAEHKGHDDLLDVLDPRVHAKWSLLWVGDGWWRGRLLERARAMGLRIRELDKPDQQAAGDGPELVLTGLVPPARVPALMRAMDVLVHPSYREGLPRTVPQALLTGTAVAAYDVDGTREACVDGQTGLLIPPGNRTRLREALDRLYAEPSLRSELARRGQEFCRDEFAAETMIRRLEAAYADARSKLS